MSSLFEPTASGAGCKSTSRGAKDLRPEATILLEEALICGHFDRGAIVRITGLPERTAGRLLAETIAAGLLGSQTPKGPLSLRFSADALDTLFPRLFPEI